MDKIDVYMNNIPKVSDDGKVIPIEGPETKEFSDLDEAKKFAADHKEKFERVTVIETKEEKQKMVERYMDGEHILPEKDDSN